MSSSFAELDDLSGRQRVAYLVDHARAGAAARRRIDHQHHTGAVGPRGSLHPQRIRGGDLRRDDRRHDPAAKHRDARSDSEAREYIARVMRADGDAGQPDQTGEQREAQSNGRALEPDTDRECGGTGRVSGRK